jgi:siroheme synthase-like protein
MRGFPINLWLQDRSCLVVGGGEEGEQRAHALLDAGARVTLLTRLSSCSPELIDRARHEPLNIEDRTVADSDLQQAWLVVQATRDADLARDLFTRCNARRIFFCAVDQPEFASFSHVASARAGALTISISTDGKAPALAKRLRRELERLLADAGAAEKIEALAALRETTPPAERRRVLTEAVKAVRFTGELRFDPGPDRDADPNLDSESDREQGP